MTDHDIHFQQAKESLLAYVLASTDEDMREASERFKEAMWELSKAAREQVKS